MKKISNYTFILFVSYIFLVLSSCKEKINSNEDELVKNKISHLKSNPTIEFPVGVPADNLTIYSLQYNSSGNYYYCNWGGFMKIINPYNPTDYSGMIIKKVVKDGQSWNVVYVTCNSAYYVDYSWGELTVNNEKFSVLFTYCSKKNASGSCAEWKSVTQTKILVKVLDPHSALSTQFALVPLVYIQDGLPIE